ncbi:MAG: GGDEF domain-containing protein [Phenylobacterium sp.]
MSGLLVLAIAMTALAVLALATVLKANRARARQRSRQAAVLEDAFRRLQRGEEIEAPVAAEGEIGRLAAAFNAMATGLRARERRLTHLAMHDSESGLPNRLALERTLAELADRRRGQVYVAALGLRRFDALRGAIGHALVAEAVAMIGARLGVLAPGSGVARIADDVLGFTMIAQSPEAAVDDAVRLMARLEGPLAVGRDGVHVAFNLGLAPLEAGGSLAGPPIELAKIALARARASHRDAVSFDPLTQGDPAASLSLMSDLLQALESGEMALCYQPKFDLRRRKVVGLETLARWRHPEFGLLSPELFLPMAEETGHVRALTVWALGRAVADQAAMAAAGHILPMAIHISGRLLGDRGFAEVALQAIVRARGPITFEVTETAVVETGEAGLEMLRRFAEAGVAIAIDGFGAGFSSLAWLKRIRGQELKVDRSIVQAVTESQRDALIVRSVIDLAHSLGLQVVAEGVESDACFALLAAMGCDHAQGPLLSPPLALKELLTFLGEDAAGLKSFG